MRRYGECVERSFAHLYDTGSLRRTHLRDHQNILKRLALWLALWMLVSHIWTAGTRLFSTRRRTSHVGLARYAVVGVW